MNANELADELDKSRQEAFTSEYLVGQAATMLRQQQVEIDSLKAKTLTDEEIKQIFQEQTGFFFDDNLADDLALMDFSRAILRKAQEK